ncbi:MAG: alpha/beta fold hydrolase [Gammaproteobacteria bacterium]|nr:alpha/beta fold hydrolase [Gammaproteobacteria bacterium]
MVGNAGSVDPEIGREITVAGFRTNLLDQGSGDPVMLIHGSGPGVTAWANWRLLIPELAKRRRVIAPDMLGFGFSARLPNAAYTVELWMQHVLGILDELAIDRTDLVGNSFGGGIALALAIRHPERIRRLILMGSAGVDFALTEGLDKVWGYEPSVENMKSLINLFVYNNDLVSDELAERRYKASIRPGFHESFSSMFPAPRQRWIESLASAESDIGKISHDVLLIHGREDQVIPLEASLKLMSLIPKAQLHVIGQCGHWTQLEYPGRFAALATQFLDEPEATA